MSVQAQLADGRVLEFPDGTDPSVVQATVKRLLDAEKPHSLMRDLGDSTLHATGVTARNLGEFAGAVGDAIANIPAMAGNLIDLPLRAAAESRGQGRQKAPFATPNNLEAAASNLADRVGLPKPWNSSERIMTAAEKGLGDAALMLTGAGEASALAKAGSVTAKVAETLASAPALQLVSGAAAGAGQQGAAEAGGGPLAQTAVGLAAGLTPFGAEAAARGLVRGAANVARPFAAAASQGAAERQAGEILASRATDASGVADALSQDGQIVNGSLPTTFQQSGDMGLGALERETATKNPEAFTQRRAEQNQARVESLQDLQAGADPNDVAKALKSQFDELDAQTQAHVDELTAAAQARAEAAGGHGTPEALGEELRAATTAAENTARARERGLWKAVDPDGTLTGNVTQTTSAAKEIEGALSGAAKPMGGEEAAIFDVAKSLPPLAPVSDLIALRSRVSTEMRNELISNGSSPSYARLTQLRGAIQDNLSTSIAHQIAVEDQAVARGAMSEEQTTRRAIEGWRDKFYGGRDQAGAINSGLGGGVAASGSPAISGVRGAGSQAGVAPVGAEGHSGLPSDAPTFDEAAASRLAAATDETKARAAMFGSGPVGQVNAKAGSANSFKLPDGRVAGKFFHPGPTGNSDMEALFKAVPRETALPIIEDYAATTLRREALDPATGTLDPKKYQGWKKRYADSLRALPPETQAKFSDAAKASQAVSEAMASRTTALKEAQAGAVGKVMGLSSPEDVVRQVGQILNGSQPAKGMMELARATAHDPAARAGLRQAVVDFIQRSLISNTEAGTSGVGLIKADQFQTFAKKAKPALKLIFTPEEVDNIDAIATDIQRAKRSENAVRLPGGSNTAQDTARRAGGVANTIVAHTVLDGLAAAAGSHFAGPVGSAVGVIGSEAVQAMRRAGINRVDELVTQAMLHPAIARRLLAKVPPKGLPSAGRSLAGAITAAQISSFAGLPKGKTQ